MSGMSPQVVWQFNGYGKWKIWWYTQLLVLEILHFRLKWLQIPGIIWLCFSLDVIVTPWFMQHVDLSKALFIFPFVISEMSVLFHVSNLCSRLIHQSWVEWLSVLERNTLICLQKPRFRSWAGPCGRFSESADFLSVKIPKLGAAVKCFLNRTSCFLSFLKWKYGSLIFLSLFQNPPSWKVKRPIVWRF